MKQIFLLLVTVGSLLYGSSNSQIIRASPPLNLTSGLMSMPKADTVTNGYLSSVDWNKFNSSSSGSVSSVALTMPNYFSVSGTPITTSGTLAVSGVSQVHNLVLASPDGISGVLTPRSLVGGDLPNPAASSLGGVQSYAAVVHQWIRQISTVGVVTGSQPDFTDLSGIATADQIPLPTASTKGGVFSKSVVPHNFLTGISTVDASVSQAQPAFTDISGSVAASQLPNPSASTLGGIQSYAAVVHQWINQISTSGVPSGTQPAFSDISGTASSGQLPVPGASSLGGVFSKAAVSHDFLTSISSVDGSVGQAQPAFSDISGTATGSQLPLPGAASLGGVFSKAVVSNNFLTGISSVDGSVSQAQPAFTNISGTAALGQLPTINVPGGGTGLTSLTAYAVLAGGTTTTANTQQVSGVGSSGQVLTSNGAGALPTWQAAAGGSFSPWNFLLNSFFDYIQRGNNITVANASSAYVADRWYVKNSLGTNGVITGTRVAGVLTNSVYGLRVKITTAPTAAQVNGTELYQTLTNANSLLLYNQTASFTVSALALANVNQVGVQFYYKTTQAKVDTAIGSETLCTVNSSTFSSCTISGQALGTAQTTSGVIGVRIRVTAVSSGNTWDINNGFTLEQANMVIGSSVPSTIFRAGITPNQELELLLPYYEKSYEPDTAPGTSTTTSGRFLYVWTGGLPSGAAYDTIQYRASKIATPSFNCWSSCTANAPNKINVNCTATVTDCNTSGAGLTGTGIFSNVGNVNNGSYYYQWTADADI